jgi:hypothetical protein
MTENFPILMQVKRHALELHFGSEDQTSTVASVPMVTEPTTLPPASSSSSTSDLVMHINNTASSPTLSISTKLKVNFGNPSIEDDFTPLQKLNTSATPIIYEAIILKKLKESENAPEVKTINACSSGVSDSANTKSASLSLTLPTGGVVIGNVMVRSGEERWMEGLSEATASCRLGYSTLFCACAHN